MNQIFDPKQIIELLATHEETLAKLYGVYMGQFPDRAFWEHLYKDELVHASWLRTIYNLSNQKKIYIDEEIFNQAAIDTSLDYLKKLILEARSQTQINALGISLDIEQAMIEKKYFKVFKTDSAEVQDIMKRLETATLVHIDLVKKELESANSQVQP